MEFRVLGPLEVAGRGTPAGVKERTLLARLLVEAGAAVPVDALLEAAWPGVPADSAARSLRVRLTALRSFLGPDVLVREGGAYRLAVEPEQVDAMRFERLVGEAAWDEALALWRGPPYVEVAYAEFVQAEIARLEELRARAEEGRAQELMERGRHEEALPALRSLVARTPLGEAPARALALALYRGGRQAEALDVLRELGARLLDLGLEPGHQTRELERAILRHEIEPPGSRSRRSGHETEPPRPRSRLFGREADLARAEALVREGPLVTIVGVGGVGKTRLARELAASFPDHWWCELAPVSRSADVAGAVRDAMGGERRPLLVLDNCEHVIDGAAEAAERLLGSFPGLLIVATSRAPLEVDGERVLRLSGLERDGAAVELFLDRARGAGSIVDPAEQIDSVRAVCAELDCLPLAIELAAARTRSLTPMDIEARLGGRLGLPGVGDRLEAAIDWSYRLLDEPQRLLFERLSVFHWPQTPEVVADVCGGTPEVLDQLVARSLVTATARDGRARYGLLRTMGEFAVARLGERGEEAEQRDRHARHVAAVAAALGADPGAGGLPFADDFEDLRAAVRWAIEREAAPDLAFAALAPMWATAHSRHAEDIAALAEEALERWPAEDHALRPAALGTAACARLACGDEAAARRHADAALALGAPALVARRVRLLIGFYGAEPGRSLELARDLSRRARAAGAPLLAIEADGFAVHALDAAGDHDAASAAAAAMRAEADRAGVAVLRTWSRYVSGVAWAERDAAEAERWLADALAEARRTAYDNVAQASLRALGVTALISGREAEAAERLREALDGAAGRHQQWATVMAAAAVLAERGYGAVAAELLAAAAASGADHPLAAFERRVLARARSGLPDAAGEPLDLPAARSRAREALVSPPP